MSIKIIGFHKEKYPHVYPVVKKIKDTYKLKNIWVIELPWGTNAGAITIVSNFVLISEKVLDIMDVNELEGIIAHEFSHLFNRDTYTNLINYLIFVLPMVYCYFTTNPHNISTTQALLFLVSIAIFIYGFKVRNWVTLNIEIRADREAVLRTKNPDALIKALFRLYSTSFKVDKRPSYIGLTLEALYDIITYFIGFTHPHIKERTEYLEFASKMLKADENTPENKLIP